MKKLGFIFRSHPHSSAKGREGLDALLAASAYSENISVFFIQDGVTQLIADQETKAIYSRNYAPTFKLMELYDIDNVYLCADSLKDQGLEEVKLGIIVKSLDKETLTTKMHQCDKLLTF